METVISLNEIDILLRFFEAFLAPVAVVIVGFILNKSLKSFEQRQHLSEKLVEERLRIYKDIAPGLNDVYCFIHCVGRWKELSPEDVINDKRTLDKSMYINKPLWSKDVFNKYNAFMDLCFCAFNKDGGPAKIITDMLRKRQRCENWQDNWLQFFKEVDGGETKELTKRAMKSYDALVDAFREDLNFGVKENFVIRKLGEIQ